MLSLKDSTLFKDVAEEKKTENPPQPKANLSGQVRADSGSRILNTVSKNMMGIIPQKRILEKRECNNE